MRTETKKNIHRIWILSAPVIAENLLQTLLGVTDAYFAGKICDEATAGIGVNNQVMNILIAVFTAISVGAVSVIARNYGRKDYRRVEEAIFHSVVLGLGLGLATGLICLVFQGPILKLCGADASTLPYARPYYWIVVVPNVVLCIQLVLSGCLRAVEDTRTPMYVTGVTNLAKIALSMAFLKVELGVAGLALATTLSRLLGIGLLLFRLANHHDAIHLRICPLRREMLAPILRIGIPASGEKLIMKAGQVVYISMVIHLGSRAYVAHTIASNLDNLAWSCAMGFGLAACTLMGVAIGEGDFARAKELTMEANAIAVAALSVIGAAIFLFAPQYAAMFTKTEEVRQMVVPILWLVALVQPFSAFLQVMIHVLQGAGDTRFPMYSTLVGIWGIRDGVGYFLAVFCGMGLIGCWCAYALDVTSRGLLLFFRFRRGRWQTIRL